MKTMPSMCTIAIFFAASTILAAALGACGSSSGNPTPTGSGSGGGSTIVGPTSSSTTTSTTSTSTSGTGGASPSSTSTSGGTGGSCTGAMGCYSCTPMTNDQFLNQCNGQTCQAYDNGGLPGLTADGGLPALP